MPTEFKLRPHHILPFKQVVEVWWNGKIIGTITGHHDPGVRIISKYPKETIQVRKDAVITEVVFDIKHVLPQYHQR